MGKKIITKVLLFLLALPLSSFAQQWIYTGLPITGAIRSVEFLDATTGWVAIANNGYSPNCKIYRTIDKGNSWSLIKEVNLSAGNSDLFMKIVNSNEGFIYYMDRVERTANLGTSWQTVLQLNNNTRKASMKFVTNDIGYLTYTYGYHVYIYKTQDGGYNWSLKKDYYYYRYDPVLKDIAGYSNNAHAVGNTQDIYSYNINQMMFSSNDWGNNWSQSFTGGNLYNFTPLLVLSPTTNHSFSKLE